MMTHFTVSIANDKRNIYRNLYLQYFMETWIFRTFEKLWKKNQEVVAIEICSDIR